MKILVFGDSIARGAFDDERGGWVERLKAHYLSSYEIDEIAVYNFSISNNTSQGVLQFIEHDIQKIKTIEDEELMIFLAIGGYDLARNGEQGRLIIEENQCVENMEKILIIASSFSDTLCIIGGSKIEEGKANPQNNNTYYYNKDLERYNQRISSIADNYKVDFISLWSVLDKDDLYDGLHPNTQGHQKIYEIVKKYIDNQISK